MKLRNTIIPGLISVCLPLCACDSRTDNGAATPGAPVIASQGQAGTVSVRIQHELNSKSPTDQSNEKDDLRITAEIRRAILDDEAMSVNAQNCKIITMQGVVTLRGVVNSEDEKDSIASKARAVKGVVRIENELEVKAR